MGDSGNSGACPAVTLPTPAATWPLLASLPLPSRDSAAAALLQVEEKPNASTSSLFINNSTIRAGLQKGFRLSTHRSICTHYSLTHSLTHPLAAKQLSC